MEDNAYRFIKISSKALLEFIYEKFIEEQGCYLDVKATEVANAFVIDWEKGNFIFCAYKDEQADGSLKAFPKDIRLDKLLETMPDTTSSMFEKERYKDYTEEQLLAMQQRD